MNKTNSSHVSISEHDINLDIVNTNMRMAVLPVTILIGIENIIGLIGNILILIVYSRKYEKSNFRYFVLFMAFIDLTSCLTCVPGELFSQLNWYKYEHAWICKVKSYFNVLGAWGSASILLLLAFDRHRKICRPLNWQIQPSLALKLCSIAVIISACVSAPITVLWGKQTYLYENGDIRVNVSVCEKSSEFTEETIYPFLYITCVYILPVGVMVVIITTLNFLTAKRLFFDRDQSLSEIFAVASARSNNNSSQASLDTISESISLQDVSATISTNIGFDKSNSDSRPVTSQRISAELTDYGDGVQRTSVTVETRKNITVRKDSSFNNLNNKTRQVNQELQKSPSNGMARNNSLNITTSSLRSSRDTLNQIGRRDGPELRVKRKTIIMLVLTTVFVITMSLYVILISLIAEQNILQKISNSEKAIYFLFLRLYFINCVINPFLYGLMDPRFCNGVKHMLCRKCTN